MPLVVGAVILFVVWYVSDIVGPIFNAIGGWLGVLGIIVIVVVLFAVISHRREQAAELEELKSTPGKVRSFVEDAQAFFANAVDAMEESKVQFEEGRAPVFWDKLEECEEALAHCVDRLDTAQELIEKYNEKAPVRELTDPAQMEPLPAAAYGDTNALLQEISEHTYQAITNSDFAFIYEQRKHAKKIADAQEKMQSEMQAKLNALEKKTSEALSAARDAASTAESAKRIGKSARGDWF